MTPDQTSRFVDALESIASDLSGIRQELDANKQTSAISHLLNTLNGFHVDNSEIAMSLDHDLSEAIRSVAGQVEEFHVRR